MSVPDTAHRVLFVCRHNAVRSRIAEALLRHRAGAGVSVTSAGVEPEPVPEAVERWLSRFDDVPPAAPQPLSAVSAEHFDTVITLCDKSHAALAEHPDDRHHIRWDFHHPDDASSLRQLEIELAERIDLLVQVNHWDRAVEPHLEKSAMS
ncbi:MAG: hypothetical protein ACPGUC_05820 [Gammaproteobacteria bacterium]